MFLEHHDDALLPPSKRLKLDAPSLQRKDQCSSASHRSNAAGCSRLSAASFSFTPLPAGGSASHAENPASPRSIWQQHPYQQPSCGGNNKAGKGFEAYSALCAGDGDGPSGPSSSVASLRAWAAAVKASAAAAVEASFDGWRGGAEARLADVEDDASSPPLLPAVEGIEDAEPAPYPAADADEQHGLCCEDDDDGAAGLAAAFAHEDLMDPCMADDDDGIFAFATDDFQFDA